MLVHEFDAVLVLLAHDDALGVLEHRTKERANSRGACSYNENGIVLGYLGYLRRPITRGKTSPTSRTCLSVTVSRILFSS